MKLSEELKMLHDSGDVGRAVEGFSERASAMEDEIDALLVQVDYFRSLYVRLTNNVEFADNGEGCYVADGELMRDFDKWADATPQQCLAEVRAQAVERYAEMLRNEANLFEMQAECRSKGSSWYNWQTYYASNAAKFANQIRRQQQNHTAQAHDMVQEQTK